MINDKLGINEMAEEAFNTAKANGFHTNPLDTVRVLSMLALIHSEVSEATEDARIVPPEELKTPTYLETGKPLGFASELADVIIRVGDTAHVLGVDLEKAVREKMAYNKTRPHRHGKRV